ncbi:MAG: hypothetical protein ACYDA9_17495 [Terriglobia bacterium]
MTDNQTDYARKMRELIEMAVDPNPEVLESTLLVLENALREQTEREVKISHSGSSYARRQAHDLTLATKGAIDSVNLKLGRHAVGNDATGPASSLIGISLTAVIISLGYSADLVEDLSDDARAALNLVLRRSCLGGQSVQEIIAQISKAIGEGELGTSSRRAQTIYRTEVGRMAHMGEQARMELAARNVPKLEKQWVASACPLRSHQAINGAHVPIRAKFEIDGEELMFPYDPAASSRNTVSCACSIMPWTKDIERFAPMRRSG